MGQCPLDGCIEALEKCIAGLLRKTWISFFEKCDWYQIQIIIYESLIRLIRDTGKRHSGNDAFQPTFGGNVPFPCSTSGFKSTTPPTSVHQLRPGDIQVVGALGDRYIIVCIFYQ